MKNYLIYCLIVLISIASCKNSSDSSEDMATAKTSKNALTLEGAWELVSFYNYVDNKVSDTIYRSDNLKQIKMYTKTKVMWSKSLPSDSLEWFGYGSYEYSDSTLYEALSYGSKTMNAILQDHTEFEFRLLLEKDRFTQIEIDEDGNPIYGENYIRIE
ncbi:MAG: hypothetical protein KJP20_13260 [Bacteroidia bacterium]|nr:hypothetical protein [Bacteroidia bacterium]NNK58997.1 hypothetical protein [Flavobacteriaceae bacterium]